MTRISYPGHPVFGDETIPQQSLPKTIHDICSLLGIEADFSITETLTSVESRVREGRKQHQNSPAVQRRKKSELLHQSNEEIIAELTHKQSELEQQRLDDVEAGEQNLGTLEALASLKAKLEILTDENRKLNEKVFDNSQAESHAYATVLKDRIRDAVYHERCEVRSGLLEQIETHIKESSEIFAQYVAMDHHTDFSRIEAEVKRGLNI